MINNEPGSEYKVLPDLDKSTGAAPDTGGGASDEALLPTPSDSGYSDFQGGAKDYTEPENIDVNEITPGVTKNRGDYVAPSFSDNLAAEFERENPFASALAKADTGPGIGTALFDPSLTSYYKNNPGLQSRLIFAASMSQQSAIVDEHNRQSENIAIQEKMSLWQSLMYGSLVAASNPLNYLGAIAIAGKAAQGASALSRMATAAGTSFVEDTATEVSLQGSQDMRTAQESAANVAFGVAINTGLGGASVFLKGSSEAIAKKIDDSLEAQSRKNLDPLNGPSVKNDEYTKTSEAELFPDDLADFEANKVSVVDGESVFAAKAVNDQIERESQAPISELNFDNYPSISEKIAWYLDKNKDAVASDIMVFDDAVFYKQDDGSYIDHPKDDYYDMKFNSLFELNAAAKEMGTSAKELKAIGDKQWVVEARQILEERGSNNSSSTLDEVSYEARDAQADNVVKILEAQRIDSAGAMKVRNFTDDEADIDVLDGNRVVGGKLFERIVLGPLGRLTRSTNTVVRNAGLAMAHNARIFRQNQEGVANIQSTPVEGFKMQAQGALTKSLRKTDEAFAEYRLSSGIGAKRKVVVKDTANALVGKPTSDGKLNFQAFDAEVHRAAAGIPLTTSDPEAVAAINKAAESTREFFDWFTKTGIEVGQFDEEIGDFAATYFPMMYNSAKITLETTKTENGFYQKLVNHWEQAREESQVRANNFADTALKTSAERYAKDTLRASEAKQALDALDEEAVHIKQDVLIYDIDPNNAGHVKKLLGLEDKPVRLTTLIRKNGGFKGGDAATANDWEKRNLVRKDGLSLDYWRVRLWEEGYFPKYTDSVNITDDEIVDLVNLDLNEGARFPGDINTQLDDRLTDPTIVSLLEQFARIGLDRKSSLLDIKDASGKAEYKRAYAEIKAEYKKAKAYVNGTRADKQGMSPGTPGSRKTFIGYLRVMEDNYKLSKMTDIELRDIAEQIFEKTKRGGAADFNNGAMPENYAFKAGPLKERLLDVDRADFWEYLEQDASLVMGKYANSVGAQLGIKANFGDSDMSTVLWEIQNEYKSNQIELEAKLNAENASAAKKQKALQKLADEHDSNIRDLEGMRDHLLGTYSTPDDPTNFWYRAARFMKNWNFVTKLGGMTISAIPDLAMPIMSFGMKDGLKYYKAFMSSPELRNASKAELEAAGVYVDLILNSRLHSLAATTDEVLMTNKFERGMEGVADAFGYVTGMPGWNALMKNISGVGAFDYLLKAAEAIDAGTASKKQIREFALAGFDKFEAADIVSTINKSPKMTKHSGIYMGDLDAIEMPSELRRRFRNGVGQYVNNTIITPGVGEMPLGMNKPLMSTILQFKSFIIAANEKTLVAGLQARDQAVVEGFLLATFAGLTTYTLKELIAGREPSDDPATLFREAFDRSGMTGLIGEADGIVTKLSGGNWGIGKLIGQENASVGRFKDRNLFGLLGPSTDMVGSVQQLLSAAANGEFDENDFKALRKMIPGQNLMYIAALLTIIDQANE